MIVIKNTIVKGKQRITVDIGPNEKLMAVDTSAMYKLGYPHEDIVHGNVVADATPVEWCDVEQKWIE